MNANRHRPGWPNRSIRLALPAGIAIFSHPARPVAETRYPAAAWEMWQKGGVLAAFKNDMEA